MLMADCRTSSSATASFFGWQVPAQIAAGDPLGGAEPVGDAEAVVRSSDDTPTAWGTTSWYDLADALEKLYFCSVGSFPGQQRCGLRWPRKPLATRAENKSRTAHGAVAEPARDAHPTRNHCCNCAAANSPLRCVGSRSALPWTSGPRSASTPCGPWSRNAT